MENHRLVLHLLRIVHSNGHYPAGYPPSLVFVSIVDFKSVLGFALGNRSHQDQSYAYGCMDVSFDCIRRQLGI